MEHPEQAAGQWEGFSSPGWVFLPLPSPRTGPGTGLCPWGSAALPGRWEELRESCWASGTLINGMLLLPLPPSHPPTHFHFHFTCGTQPCNPSPAINNPRSTRDGLDSARTCLIYPFSSSGAAGVLHGGDVTPWGCHLCPVVLPELDRGDKICPNTLHAAQELNMKRSSCSQSPILVTDKLPLTWNRVENKQRGKGHVNNSFPQNPGLAFLLLEFFPLLLLL